MLKSVEGNVHFRVGRIVKFLQGFAQRALVTPVGRLTDQSLTRQWLPPSGDYSLMKSIIGRRSYHNDDFERDPSSISVRCNFRQRSNTTGRINKKVCG